MLAALQRVDADNVVTPEGWHPGDDVLGHELEDRRLQPLGTGRQVVNLDIGKTFGTVNANKSGVSVDIFA